MAPLKLRRWAVAERLGLRRFMEAISIKGCNAFDWLLIVSYLTHTKIHIIKNPHHETVRCKPAR